MDGHAEGAQSVKILYGVNVISENSPSSHPPPLGAGMLPILPQARGSSTARIADVHSKVTKLFLETNSPEKFP